MYTSPCPIPPPSSSPFLHAVPFSLSLPAIPLSTVLLMFLQLGWNPVAMSPERQPVHTNEEPRGRGARVCSSQTGRIKKKKDRGKKKSPSPLHFKSPPSPFSPHLSSSSSLSSLWNNRENGSCKRQTRVEKQGEEKGQTRRCKQRTEVREMVTWERDGWRGKENESR